MADGSGRSARSKRQQIIEALDVDPAYAAPDAQIYPETLERLLGADEALARIAPGSPLAIRVLLERLTLALAVRDRVQRKPEAIPGMHVARLNLLLDLAHADLSRPGTARRVKLMVRAWHGVELTDREQVAAVLRALDGTAIALEERGARAVAVFLGNALAGEGVPDLARKLTPARVERLARAYLRKPGAPKRGTGAMAPKHKEIADVLAELGLEVDAATVKRALEERRKHSTK